jgi:hypothetical protein
MWMHSAGKHVPRNLAEGCLRDRKRDENVFKFMHEKSRTANRNKRRFNAYLVADSKKNTCSVMLTKAAK